MTRGNTPVADLFWRRHAGIVAAATEKLAQLATGHHDPATGIRSVAGGIGRLAAHGITLRMLRRRTAERPEAVLRLEAELRKETYEDARVHVEWTPEHQVQVSWDLARDGSGWHDPCETRPLSAWLGPAAAVENDPPDVPATIWRLSLLERSVCDLTETRSPGQILTETPPSRVLHRGAGILRDALAAVRGWSNEYADADDEGPLAELVDQIAARSQATMRLRWKPQRELALAELRCRTNRGLQLEPTAGPDTLMTAVDHFTTSISVCREYNGSWTLETDEWSEACLGCLAENDSEFGDRRIVRETLTDITRATGAASKAEAAAATARRATPDRDTK